MHLPHPAPLTGHAGLDGFSTADFDDISSVDTEASTARRAGSCLRCNAIGGRMIACRNALVSLNGLPCCNGYWCPGCYRAEDGVFTSFRPDRQGLRMRPMDCALRAFRCHICDVQGLLGRAADPDASECDWELLQLAVQYKIDARLCVLETTGSKYAREYESLLRHAAKYHINLLPKVEPEAPPAFNPSLLVGTAMVRATSALHGRGRGADGAAAYGTARGKRTALDWAARYQPRAQASFQEDPEFVAFCAGLPKRIGNVVTQAYPLDIKTLLALVGTCDARVAELEAAEQHAAALLEASYRLTLVIAYFAITRGNDPFRLQTGHFDAGLWLGDDAARGAVTPHIRIAFNFPTKALQTKWTDGILAGTTASGVRIGDYALHYLECRRRHGNERRGQWALPDGLLLPAPGGGRQDGKSFVHDFLRPRLLALQRAGDHPPLYRADLSAGRINMWSVRIGAESWALADDPRAPALSETDVDAHVGWLSGRNGNKNARTMARRYNTPPIEQRIRATARHM